MKAGDLLGGRGGAGRALALFLDALSYSREHLTDGFVPDHFLYKSPLVSAPKAVAKAMAHPEVNLLHRVNGGYLIHDFHDWNKSAKEIKEIRARWRANKATQRRGGNGQYSRDSTKDTFACPRETLTETRARAVPRSTYVLQDRQSVV